MAVKMNNVKMGRGVAVRKKKVEQPRKLEREELETTKKYKVTKQKQPTSEKES